MKKLILALGIFFSGVLFAQAQQPAATPEKQAEKMINKVTEVCSLTSDQVNRVTPLIKQFVNTRAENRAKYANNKQELQEANKENRDNLHNNLKPILSEDQMAKLKEYMKEKKESQGNSGE